MISSIADVFNTSDAVINDPYEEIHNHVRSVNKNPSPYEFADFLDYLDEDAYPLPKGKSIIHNSVSNFRTKLKSVYK